MTKAAVVLCVTLMTALGYAQQVQPGEAIAKSKLEDGHYWQTLDEAKKEIWLRAYVHGVAVAEIREAILPKNLDAEGRSKPWPFDGISITLVPQDMTWGDAIRSIDEFYRERENLGIVVSNAMEVVSMRSRRIPEQRIQMEIVQMRRSAAANVK